MFPPHGVDQTIHVAILIGILVLLVLTETFGWVFTGLVVPGYLASLFVLEPASAATVVFEALLTFAVSRVVSDLASRSGAWSAFFGRERFLLLVFVSIAVRQACELWLVPDVLGFIDERLDTSYRLARTFSSVGLVLVPLTANTCWKLDVRRGVIQVAVPTLATFAILYLVLLPYTNLSFARLEISHENVALDFIGSPKAYILLLTSAYLASRYNLRYGWDYAGILVPALLTLAWFSPFRLVTTLVETVTLVGLVRTITWAPGLRTANIEGPRKVALVFAISFLLKWGLGWVVDPTAFGGTGVTDLFGFGYLLSSLLAVKILQKDTVGRIAVPTALVSVLALIVGSALGFGLDQLAPSPAPIAIARPIEPSPVTTVLARTPRGVVALGHVRARLDIAGDVPLARGVDELDRYAELWAAIAGWLDAPGDRGRLEVERRAASLGLVVRPAGTVGARAAWAVFELEERLIAHVGWDTALLVPGARGPVIAVPRPASEPPTAEVAAALCERIACRAVIVSGLDLAAGIAAGRQPHGVACGALRDVPTLALRADASLARGRAVLHLANEQPELNVSALWPRGLELSWQASPLDPESRASILRAHPDDYWNVVADVSSIAIARDVSIEAWFARWFDSTTSAVDPRITHRPPSQSELRFLELLVAKPALDGDDLRIANAMAGIIGYEARILADGVAPDSECWLIAEASPRQLGWGVVLGRVVPPAVPGSGAIAIEVPRPRRETGTWRLGVELWRRSGAAALLVADGDIPDDRSDADPTTPWNTTTTFQAFHQAIHGARTFGGRDRGLILQVRGFGIAQPFRDPVVVALTRPVLVADQVPPRLAALLAATAESDTAIPRYYDGARELVELAGTGNPQLDYCARFETASCATLWFSPSVRARYGEVDRARELATLVRASLPLTFQSASAALLEPALGAPDPARAAALRRRFAAIVRTAEAYAVEHNVHLLRELSTLASDLAAGIDVRAGSSDELGRPFLRIELREADHVVRGVVLIPAGIGQIDLDAGTDSTRVSESLARRPRVITVTGRAPDGARRAN